MVISLHPWFVNMKDAVQTGFSLIEIAVVLVILSILLAAVAIPLSSQLEQRRSEETNRQLELAKEAIIGFALSNGRLPCPARFLSDASNSRGRESFCTAASGSCAGAETTVIQTHGNCSNFSGLVPAATLGIAPIDELGFAVDAWQLPQNRIRYAVMDLDIAPVAAPNCLTIQANVLTAENGIRNASMSCIAGKDLLKVCSLKPAANPGSALSCDTVPVDRHLTKNAPFVLVSLGKNAPTGALTGTDEAHNVDSDVVFVAHSPTSSGSPNGEFDDIVTWASLNTLFARMVQAGKLP